MYVKFHQLNYNSIAHGHHIHHIREDNLPPQADSTPGRSTCARKNIRVVHFISFCKIKQNPEGIVVTPNCTSGTATSTILFPPNLLGPSMCVNFLGKVPSSQLFVQQYQELPPPPSRSLQASHIRHSCRYHFLI